MADEKPLVIMAKPVGSRCNMHCSYCYYLEKGRYSSHETQSVISDELLEKLIKETVTGPYGPTVSFVWHGGEPTIAGLPFYRRALQLERRYQQPGQHIWNNLQTNGLLIDDKWAQFLKRHSFDVGVSIDGDALVHDTNRPDAGGHPTWERVVKAIRCLQKYELQPDLLCTVNSASVKDPLRVYRALRELNTGWIQFIPIMVRTDDGSCVTLSEESINGEEYGEFLCTIFDEWVTNDIGSCDVQFFAECAHIMAGSSPSLCWMAPTCGRVLIAEEDGAIYACDHFVDDEHRLGMLQTEDLQTMADSPQQQTFGQSKLTALTAECRSCPYLKYCNGACPKDRFGISADGETGQYWLCSGLKRFFAHALPIMEKVMGWVREGNDNATAMKKASRLVRKGNT